MWQHLKSFDISCFAWKDKLEALIEHSNSDPAAGPMVISQTNLGYRKNSSDGTTSQPHAPGLITCRLRVFWARHGSAKHRTVIYEQLSIQWTYCIRLNSYSDTSVPCRGGFQVASSTARD